MKERRQEPRTQADFGLVVWGIDTRGERLQQNARAHNVSLSGALLTGLNTDLRPGDVIGILYAGKSARFRVIWVHHPGPSLPMEAAVHRFQTDDCPWQDQLGSKDEPAIAGAV